MIGRAMRGSVLAPTPLPPHSKNETIRRGRRPAQRTAANRQVKVSRGTTTRKNETTYSQGGGPETARADISPQLLSTPIAQAPSPYLTWRATPWPKTIRTLTKTCRRNRAYTGRMSCHQRCDCPGPVTAVWRPVPVTEAGGRLTQQLFVCAHSTRIVNQYAAKKLLQQPHGQCGEQKWGDRVQAKANAPTARTGAAVWLDGVTNDNAVTTH